MWGSREGAGWNRQEDLERWKWASDVGSGCVRRRRARPRGGQRRLDHENGDAAWMEQQQQALALALGARGRICGRGGRSSEGEHGGEEEEAGEIRRA